MALEKWLIHPGETRVIDLDAVRTLKVGLVGGQIDVIGHDEPGTRIEVHGVSVKDLRIEVSGDAVEINHPQLRWDNFLEVFRNFGAGGPKAEISVAVPRDVALNLGVVSASALVNGLAQKARLSSVSGDLIVDGLDADLTTNTVSADVQVRGLNGALSANSVSGDVAATGGITSASVDTVSGGVLVDASGPIHKIGINTVSGAATVRLDQDEPANYVVRSVSGRVKVDGELRSIRSGTPGTNFVDSVGELAGSFVDLRANSVSGDVTVVRRPAASVVVNESPAEVEAPATTDEGAW